MNCATQLHPDLRFDHVAHLVVLGGVPQSPPKGFNVAEFFVAIGVVFDDHSPAHVSMPVTTDTTTGIVQFTATGINRPAGAYRLDTPTAAVNRCCSSARRSSRGDHIRRSGVGKTSMVQTLSTVLGISLTCVNLDEYMDIGDLFGTALPFEDSTGGFGGCGGVVIPATKQGLWLLLENNIGRDDNDGAFIQDVLDGEIVTNDSIARTWRRTV